MANDYELLPSSSSRPRIAVSPTSTTSRPSFLQTRLRFYGSLARKNPLLALLVVLGSLALVHEVFVVAGTAAQFVVGRAGSVTSSKKVLQWDELVESLENDTVLPSTRPGSHYRDHHPLRSAAHFLTVANLEIKTLGLDTCDGKLSSELALAYNSTSMSFCSPSSPDSTHPPTSITCLPNHHSPFLSWWPYPASYCLSSNILGYPRTRPAEDQTEGEWKLFKTVGCDVTPEGETLREEMGNEKFLGSMVEKEGEEGGECEGGKVDHPLLFVGRQDRWNPFHVAEDFVTTFLAMILGGMNRPALLSDDHRIQLVFTDEFEVSGNHFTSVWDRIGGYAPRRMSLDPFKPKTCISQAIHSIGAGASLLSATDVGKELKCASSLTWASSHYFRHLFGLSPSSPKKRAINILWLSRAKMEKIAHEANDWSSWRETRHILNEPALVERLKSGLEDVCRSRRGKCRFSDAEEEPERWSEEGEDELEIRFAQIDPVTQAIETQIDFVGHSTILVGLHGGSLGLSLFLPPGPRSSVVELRPPGTEHSYHFHNMAQEMGVSYDDLLVLREVDVEAVWRVVKRRVDVELASRTV